LREVFGRPVPMSIPQELLKITLGHRSGVLVSYGTSH
jgi:NAD dependent epimerase/dehydratase family enzyme